MSNGVAVVNSTSPPKCGGDLSDIELVCKGVDDVYHVTEDGQIDYLKETYADDSYPAYYFCCECSTDWTINAVQDQEQCWKLVKAHFE